MLDDPNYRVENVPPAIRGKITQLINAAHDAARSGSYEPDIAREVEELELLCRYELEQTIMTHLRRKT